MYSYTEKKRVRKDFSRNKSILELSDLLNVQIDSYNRFTQQFTSPEQRIEEGLEAVFQSIFPIVANNNSAQLEFLDYRIGHSDFDVEECISRGVNYAAPVFATLRLVLYQRDNSGNYTSRVSKVIENNDVYICELPLMTDDGSFIINGTERVVVSQVHRSPGVFFDHDKGRSHSSGKLQYKGSIIPYRGTWIDFEVDHKELVSVRVDRRRKLLATVFLKALGYDSQEILDAFYTSEVIKQTKDGYNVKLEEKNLKDEIALFNIVGKTGDIIIEKGSRISAGKLKVLNREKIKTSHIEKDYLVGRHFAKPIFDSNSGTLIFESNTEITETMLKSLVKLKIKTFEIIYTNELSRSSYIGRTLNADNVRTQTDALFEIYKLLRPGEPPTMDQAVKVFRDYFFNPERFSLSRVGRMKFNSRLGRDSVEGMYILFDGRYLTSYLKNNKNFKHPIDWTRIEQEYKDFIKFLKIDKSTIKSYKDLISLLENRRSDFIDTLTMLFKICNGNNKIDDIDHMGNRRVRSVGELVENHFMMGLIRIEKGIKERLNSAETDELNPKGLVNPKPISSSIKEFFASSQLSQFMDQCNPLAEVTHKRKLSALGTGGLTRERAGFEVRDVHPTHYGRLCPIETPEGPNIGLINSLAGYAKINSYGFIETPFRKVIGGKVSEQIDYISAIDESDLVIAQAAVPVDEDGNLTEDLVMVRLNGEFVLRSPDDVQYMDVSNQQIVSIAASLIPFLEHNDANRALMGSNMQRQAVPLLKSDKPLVGTHVERKVASDSGVCVIARRSGVVLKVDSSRIVIQVDFNEVVEGDTPADIYNLVKYQRSNQNTCINQRPLVQSGDRIRKGDILADASASDLGELALGQNLKIAFMPWGGYNFEDSILISETVAIDDKLTSIHIQELECIARETRLGREEITADIPNISEQSLNRLDESGIVFLGSEVESGDILVGKIQPKAEVQVTPEERLLRAIFGEKASKVKDSSLRVPSSTKGTVISVKIYSRKEYKSEVRSVAIRKEELRAFKLDLNEQLQILSESLVKFLSSKLVGKKVNKGKGLKKGDLLTTDVVKQLDLNDWLDLKMGSASDSQLIENAKKLIEKQKQETEEEYAKKEGVLSAGEDLAPGVLVVVKVYLAVKRRIQPGDKLAGRHGNKGVISMIKPVEDMPYDENGNPVEVVLNPLGVPSRMNIGQVLECHLGLAARGLGDKIDLMLKKRDSASKVSAFLQNIYQSDYNDQAEFISQLAEQDLFDLAHNLRAGVPMATPVFDGAREDEIQRMMKLAGVPFSGQVRLYDGRTGDAIDRKVTVGYMYMLKLNHLVDYKMHARSTGSYSLVTQQPLGGKAQFGGQRLGEMEVWALEAYGAAFTLQEMLTIKSDDLKGRANIYKKIIDGSFSMDAGIPESFNVLMYELRSLAINLSLDK